MSTHLIIPDAHAQPGVSNRRFDWLGNVIVDTKPDTVICLGDFADMESLCSYDKGTKGFEGRRYKKDVNVTLDAQERMFAPLRKLQKAQTKRKVKQYNPRMIMCLGNHEARIDRAIQKDAILDGTISIDDLQYKEFGWEVHPFLAEVDVDGVAYSHYFVSGVMGKPIGGEHPATTLLNKMHKSCTAGHSHLADWSVRRAGNEHIMGLVGGCYFEHDMEYVPPVVNRMYWRGLVIKYNVHHGRYDPEFYSLNTIKKEYNKK